MLLYVYTIQHLAFNVHWESWPSEIFVKSEKNPNFFDKFLLRFCVNNGIMQLVNMEFPQHPQGYPQCGSGCAKLHLQV
jgi:hypothetical protein